MKSWKNLGLQQRRQWKKLSKKFSIRNFRKKMEEEEIEVGKEKKKKKRGEGEEKEEKGNGSEVDDFLSNNGFELMEKKPLKTGFIGERGFKEIIPPFKEIIEKINWIAICKHLPLVRAAIVREFYVNFVVRQETMCYVRAKWISFHKQNINHMLGLGRFCDGQKFKKLKENPDYQKILEVLTDGKREWKKTKRTPMSI